MKRTILVASSGAFAVGIALAADTASPTHQSAAEDSMLSMLTMKPGTEMSEADRGYMKAMQAMQQTLMKTEMTGNPGGDFARVMIPHHQSTIDMVDVLLAEKVIDPDIRSMAEQMREQQAKEIARLQAWPRRHPNQEPCRERGHILAARPTTKVVVRASRAG